MGKNIILFSDGTGNKGGHGADTNVFRLFNAVNIHDGSPRQITFYDDGVGTSKNKYWKGLTGAFGFGLEANVWDLYEFLARNYSAGDGDKVYLFGFSRGAATVRAFAGMVQECGLLDTNNDACKIEGIFDEDTFQDQLKEAQAAYRKIKSAPSLADNFKNSKAVTHPEAAPHGNIPIQMIGVWDTVSALGFPQDWSGAVDWIFRALNKVSEIVFPHQYYNYQLNKNVQYVCHALAIDDERTTFHPKVWNEKRADRPAEIEQVWFSGVHSNVGGGYPRSGMSMISLDWMMERASNRGIRFIPGAHEGVRAAANVHGRLYDSRSGPAIYYRYGPRDITELCRNVPTPIKIHESVVERIDRGTARYAPRSLPYDVEIVGTKIGSKVRGVATAKTADQWRANHQKIWRQVAKRKVLYRFLAESTLLLVVVAGYFWNGCPGRDACPPGPSSADTVWVHMADVLKYFLPTFFDDFITFIVPYWLAIVAAYFIVLRVLRNRWRKTTQAACETARRAFLAQVATCGGNGEDNNDT